mmetsp:Transcript_15320/g.46703  ORF Transcript_15320/g.46703 Transcript_15320/m.46703 type:complete len:537 (-) Transcript_15320:186-1796(-)
MVIKLAALTKVQKVYRGISSKRLPERLLRPDATNAQYGIEFGFMSTTTDHAVAMHYASLGVAGMLFEVQMGVLDRGADLSCFSQYPHEQEILFPAMTCIEVAGLDTQGSVLVIRLHASVNRLSGTLTELVSKRRKLVQDIAANLRSELDYKLFAGTPEWNSLTALVPSIHALAKSRHHTILHDLSSRDVHTYNDGNILGQAISYAVQAHDMISGWPRGFAALAAQAFDQGPVSMDGSQPTSIPSATTIDSLVHRMELKFDGPERLGASGGSVLAILLSPQGVGPAAAQELEAKKMELGELGGAELFEAVRCGAFPRLQRLALDANHLGIHAAATLGRAMVQGALNSLLALWLNDNLLGDEGCAHILHYDALHACPRLSELCLNNVGLSSSLITGVNDTRDGSSPVQGAHRAHSMMCAAIKKGALAHLERLNLINNNIGDVDVRDLADVLATSPAGSSLVRLQLENNQWGDDGLDALVHALRDGGLRRLLHLELHLNRRIQNQKLMDEMAKLGIFWGLETLKQGMVPPYDQHFKQAK